MAKINRISKPGPPPVTTEIKTSLLWCDKVLQKRHYKVCQRHECSNLKGSEELGFECNFENSKTKRAKKGQKIKELKKVKDVRRPRVR